MTHTLFMYALRLGFNWLVGLCVIFVVAKNEVYDIPLKTDLNFVLTPFHFWTDLMWFCVSVFKKGSIQTCCLLQRNFITHVWGKMYGLITNTWTTFYMHGKLFTRWHTPMCICHPGLCCKSGSTVGFMWKQTNQNKCGKSAYLCHYFFCCVCTMYM